MLKKFFCLLITATLLGCGCPLGSSAAIAEEKTAQVAVEVDLWQYTVTEGTVAKREEAGGRKGHYVFTEEEGSIQWQVEIPTEADYSLRVTYYTEGGKGASIVRNLYLDGADNPVGNGCVFSRAYVNESDEIATDQNGNQIRSVQIEQPMWLTADFRDPNGYNVGAIRLHLTKGSHTVILESVREPMLIGQLEFYVEKPAISYADYRKQTENLPSNDCVALTVQGEDAILKSDSMLYQLTDRSSSATQPSNAMKTVINTIGSDKWSSFGQWLCWEVEIKQAGYYRLSLRAKQDTVPGQPSYRRVAFTRQDGGKAPDFEELNSVKFPYSNHWEMISVGDGENAYRLYFEPGIYTIKMEVVLGEMSGIIRRVEESMKALNDIYLSLLMLIGPTPDTYRDYQFTTYLPQEIKALGEQSKVLDELYQDYRALCDTNSSQAQSLKNLAILTAKMNQKPNKIASVFSEFSDSISALGTWITTARKQALEVDYLCLTPYSDGLPRANAPFFRDLAFGFRQFIASFVNEYDSAKNETDQSNVTVWLSSGRDQANALINMADNDFTPQTGIKADVQLVVAGTLLTATLAGRGPDVALTLDQSLPVNYAIRGAVRDLSGFDGFQEVVKSFQPSAMVPLTFNGAVYGLPETQSFYVMFYRTDILEKLGLSVPQTWSDVIAMLPILNQNNLNFGLPIPMSTTVAGVGFKAYAMFLYQNGGSFYTSGGEKALLDSDQAATAFKMWTDFYTQYSLPYEYNFQNRFRSGEIPIGIADYGTYNVLSVFAPELNGLWNFALVPGVECADGSINRSIAGAVTACVMLNDAKNPDNAWEFLKWWTSADTQEFFGREIESIMGTAARYQTANIAALNKIPWNTKDLKVLLEQWQYTEGIPEVPGSYMTSRYLDFGFKQVLLHNTAETDPIQVLNNQNKRINEEIKAKRKEFALQ